MTPIRAVIVDDEPLARRGVRLRLERAGDFEIVAECETGRAGVQAVRTHRPDVAFLDVQMPGWNGLTAAAELAGAEQPLLVFVTAHADYALPAFDAAAADYLLKPLTDRRFDEMLDRIRTRLARGHGRPLTTSTAFTVRQGNKTCAIAYGDIEAIHAEGDYIRIATPAGGYVSRMSITAALAALPTPPFARVHRSTLINAAHILSVEQRPSGEARIQLRSGAVVQASRAYRSPLRALLHATGV